MFFFCYTHLRFSMISDTYAGSTSPKSIFVINSNLIGLFFHHISLIGANLILRNNNILTQKKTFSLKLPPYNVSSVRNCLRRNYLLNKQNKNEKEKILVFFLSSQWDSEMQRVRKEFAQKIKSEKIGCLYCVVK